MMAMIPCPECKYEISDKSLTCPKCHCLIASSTAARQVGGLPPPVPVPAAAAGQLKISSFMELFFKVWVQPRKTIRKILDSNRYYGVWLMIIIVSCTAVYPTDKSPLWAQLVALPFFVAFLYLFFWVIAALVFTVGLTFGAKSRMKEVFVTTVWTLPLNAAQFIIAHGANLQGPAYYGLLAVNAGVLIWILFVDVVLYSEVFRITIGKSIAIYAVIGALSVALFMLFGYSAADLFNLLVLLKGYPGT